MNVHWNYRLLWNWPCAWHHPVSSDPDADHLDSKMVKSLTRKLFYQRLHFSISRRARDKSSIWNKFWGLWHTKEFKLYFKNNKMSVDQLVIGRFIQKFIKHQSNHRAGKHCLVPYWRKQKEHFNVCHSSSFLFLPMQTCNKICYCSSCIDYKGAAIERVKHGFRNFL